MERSAAATGSGTAGTSFYSILNTADVDIDLRALIDRWSADGETIVVQRPRSVAWR